MDTTALRQVDIIRFLQGGHMRYVIMAVNLLLVVWIASQLAGLTWSVISPGEEAVPEAAAVRATPAQADPDRRLIGQLPAWHLLGVAPKQTAPVKTEVPADAPETRLQLTLRGALASDDPNNARAIIADPSGRDEQYSIGDAVPGNAELSEIFPDRVILKRNGRYETLRLPQESASTPATTIRARQTQRRRPAVNQPQTSNLTQQLQNVREQLRNNPQTMAGLLRVSPHTDDSGSVIGYAVSPGRDPAMFEQLGLVDGDVVIEVNDMAMSDPNNGAQALAALRSGQPVTVKLLRDGQEQIVSLDGL